MTERIYYNPKVLASSGLNLAEIANRGTGRTTSMVLKAIAAAISNPGSEVRIYDHARIHRQTKLMADHAAAQARDTIYKLGLESIDVKVERHHSDEWYVQVVNNFARPAAQYPKTEIIIA